MTHFFFLSFFLFSFFLFFFVLSFFLLYFSKMISNYIASVSWLTMRNCKKISNKPSSLFRATEPEFTCRTERKIEKFFTSSVSAGNLWTQIHSATAVQAVQINVGVITWSKAVSCLAGINVNKTWRQMSVKQIRIYIKAKRKIHDNLSHKEHSIHFPHSHSLFVNLPQMLRQPPPPTPPPFTNKQPLTHEKRKESNLYVSNISAVQ